jgi:hypothetical protein
MELSEPQGFTRVRIGLVEASFVHRYECNVLQDRYLERYVVDAAG